MKRSIKYIIMGLVLSTMAYAERVSELQPNEPIRFITNNGSTTEERATLNANGTFQVDAITDKAGSGPVNFPYGISGATTGINYISNNNIEANVDDYNLYNDSSSTPVDGTGGTASQLTISRNTISPLRGTGDLKISSSGSAQGEGVSVDFTIDNLAKNQKMMLYFYNRGISNFVFGTGSFITVCLCLSKNMQYAVLIILMVFVLQQ